MEGRLSDTPEWVNNFQRFFGIEKSYGVHDTLQAAVNVRDAILNTFYQGDILSKFYT